MLRAALVLASLIVAGLGAANAQAPGSLEVPTRASEAAGAPEGPRVKLYGASKALVIGLDDYGGSGWFAKGSGWPKLSMAIKDAEAVARALTEQGFAVTFKKDLASADLDSVFRQFFIGEGADPEARLLIWFAGHGHTINGEGYLVPVDAPDPRTADVEFRSKALSLRRFGEYMREARAKHVLAVFDSCFAGTVFNVARAAPSPAITYSTTLPVRQLISSGEAEQVVSDDGTFRKLFIDALRGLEAPADPNRDGYITGSELGQFLFDKVTTLTNQKQTPRYGKLNALGFDRGDFVLEAKRAEVVPVPPVPTISEAARAWEMVQGSENAAVLEGFRKQFGAVNPFYDSLAASRIAELADAEKKRRTADTAAAKAEADLEAAEAKRKAGEAAAEAKRREEQRVAMLAEEERRAKGSDPSQQTPSKDTTIRRDVPRLVAPPRVLYDSRQGTVFRDCPACPEMVWLPAGSFTMGSPKNEVGRDADEGPQRTVTIAKPFAVGKFEVTFAEWDACAAAGGCKHKPTDNGWGRGGRPVINVSWDDAKQYVAWLSKKTGKPYRLLTEAEWEFAARAGTTTRYSWGNDIDCSKASYNGGEVVSACYYSPGGKLRGTSAVGNYAANAFGLHDMHGNVWEWVEDCYQGGYSGAPSDGTAISSGDCSRRVLRGGSWSVDPAYVRSAIRSGDTSGVRDDGLGFRVARTLP